MPAFRYLHLDVFAASPGGGNHLGVVVDAKGWSDAAMQAFARWSNLVETVFLAPASVATASYRVRIFTPMHEIAYAGHPSVGSAHAALYCGLAQAREGLLWQECQAGVLPIRVLDDGAARELLLRTPAARVLATGLDAHALLPAALAGARTGILPPALVEGGRRWWLAEIADEASLRAWQPDHGAIRALAEASSGMGLCAFARSRERSAAGSGRQAYQLVVRAFAAGVGIIEDPASGAANGLLAAYLAQAEPSGPLAHGYVVSQGREMGHDARLRVSVEADAIWVGGPCRTVIDGSLDWSPE
ncbi:MAG: PhzF family phenazine biosynthesis protein [Xanthomonadales bacterium]|nr:PhzF family phenazine biosynthesis protein [Xanthomonadales bacterium]